MISTGPEVEKVSAQFWPLMLDCCVRCSMEALVAILLLLPGALLT